MITTQKLSRTSKLLFPLLALVASACSHHDDSKATPALSFQSAQSTFELENYYSTGVYPLSVGTGDNLLAAEASGITYNQTTGTFFVIGDGGTSIVQVSKTGALIDSMELAPNAFADTEGISWVSGNQFVLVEERLRQVDQFTYVAGSTLDASGAKTVKLGTTIGNIGLEGISYDPTTTGYILAKQMDPMGIFQTTINFTAGTASNGSPTTDESINLFDPAKLNFPSASVNDVFAVSNILPAAAPDYDNLVAIDATDGKVVKIDRAGNIQSTLAIDAAGQDEGVTMDTSGNLYTVGEKAAGGDGHPGMTVFTPTKSKNAVGVSSNLYLTFSQVVTAGSGNIVLSNGAGDVRNIPVGDAQVTISGKVVKINPTFDLAPGTTYSITFASGVLTGADAVSDTSTLSFKTVGEVDTTAPTLASSTPVDDAANITVDAPITLNFSETVRPGSGNIMIVSASSDTRTIDVTDTSQVTFNGSTVSITPSAPLQNSTAYNVQMTNGVITDTSGNAFAGLLTSSALNFTTISLVVAAPTVLITELNSNEIVPSGVDFFEIYNYGSTAVDISGWKWTDNHATAIDANNYEIFPSNTVIPAGGRLVVNNDPSNDPTAFKTAWGLDSSTTVLAMGTHGIGLGKGDAVILFGSDGKVVTALNYGPAVDTTQGDKSTVSVPTATASSGVKFASGSHAGTAFGGTDSSSAVWDGVSTSSPAYKAAVVGDALGSYAAPGNAADIGSPGKPMPVAAPAVLITEVNSNEVSPSGVDFFELYNYGTADLDISNWMWSDNNATVVTAGKFEVFPANTVIPAGKRIVVTNDTHDPSVFKTAWGLTTTTVLSMGTNNIGLGKGDAVTLFGSDGKLVTAMNYGTTAVIAKETGGTTVSIPPATASTGVTFAASNSHAGTAFGGTDSSSAVWDGVSTSSPAYKAAVAGDALGSFAQASPNSADVGSPGQ